MARIWSESYDSLKHAQAFMPEQFGGWAAQSRQSHAPTLIDHRVMLVRVCGFTFLFHTIEEMRACREYYAAKLHPSSRSAAAARAVHAEEVTWRLEVQRWYERLPLYLREEPKRIRVLAALERAVRMAEAGEI